MAAINPIQAQDIYIETVSNLDPKKGAYCSNVSRARNKAIKAIMDFGFTLNQADRLVTEAHDVAQHHRFVKSIQ